MRLAIGEVVDERCTIERLLGEGGFGETHRAVDGATGQRVVLNLPHIALAGDLAAYNRYQREIDIGGRLGHPGIQRLLLDGAEARGHRPYMVLEYVDGESLRSYLHARGPLAVDEVLRRGGQPAEALGYIHGQGVVHRDPAQEAMRFVGLSATPGAWPRPRAQPACWRHRRGPGQP